MYAPLESLLPCSRRLGGIAPPRSFHLLVMTWPDGRMVSVTPRLTRRIISGLYCFSTFLLSALGQGVFESHHTRFTALLTRMRLTFTHSAGAGIAPGLYQ